MGVSSCPILVTSSPASAVPLMSAAVALLIAYLCGSLPIGLGIARWVKGVDIRDHGSGNIGATNVGRVIGKKWGIMVLLLDAIKGGLPTLLLPMAFEFAQTTPEQVCCGMDRFANEQRWTRGEGADAESGEDFYSVMVCRMMMVTKTGPAVGEIVTQGDLLHPGTGEVLASFTQKTSLARGRNVVEIEVDLQPVIKPDADPWSNYFTMRFAWMDSTAAVTRSVLGTTQGFRGQRIESPQYIEIADSDTRTAILMNGLPFHRRSENRMIDTILQVEGESTTKFRFGIALEDACPMQAAVQFSSPVPTLAVAGPPAQRTGWLFRVSHRNVRVLRYCDLLDEPEENGKQSPDPLSDEVPFMPTKENSESQSEQPAETVSETLSKTWPRSGFAVRLQETEGRRTEARLQFVRTPQFARSRDFTGATLSRLTIQNDEIAVTLQPFEIVEVELRFEA